MKRCFCLPIPSILLALPILTPFDAFETPLMTFVVGQTAAQEPIATDEDAEIDFHSSRPASSILRRTTRRRSKPKSTPTPTARRFRSPSSRPKPPLPTFWKRKRSTTPKWSDCRKTRCFKSFPPPSTKPRPCRRSRTSTRSTPRKTPTRSFKTATLDRWRVFPSLPIRPL